MDLIIRLWLLKEKGEAEALGWRWSRVWPYRGIERGRCIDGTRLDTTGQ